MSLLNNENQTTILGVYQNVYIITEIALYKSGLPQEFPHGKLLAIDQICQSKQNCIECQINCRNFEKYYL